MRYNEYVHFSGGGLYSIFQAWFWSQPAGWYHPTSSGNIVNLNDALDIYYNTSQSPVLTPSSFSATLSVNIEEPQE